LGARKRDISRIFNAETMIIGASAGIIGVFISWIFTLIISAILVSLSGIAKLAYLEPLTALYLVLISAALTVVSGLIPSRIAANKDPVVALRTE
ncbi:MAG: FtsX-like permease family protein, partial [Clostridia bacterium]|nr:FtsX-like permease family protein [Clostridia bacterium]